ncbi:MAG TPA: hypothetical protein VIQ30_22795 [Pseudonocardia sp.]
MTRLAQLPRPVRAAIGAAFVVDGWHHCPGHNCDQVVSPGHVGCRTCWLCVPRRERQPLTDAFRNRENDLEAYHRAEKEAVALIRQHTGGAKP